MTDSTWQTAEWQEGMPVILVKEDHRVIHRIPVDAPGEAVPDGAGALLWLLVQALHA